MGFFGGGNKQGGNGHSNGGNGKPRTATNAPRHWPAVSMTWADNWAHNALIVGGTLLKGLQPSGGSIAFYQHRLYDDGVLKIPLMVIEGEQQTAVFMYPRADATAAAHFSAVRGLLRQRDGMQAVYYAPDAIQPAKPSVVVEPIDTPHFSRIEKERPPADYALWWPTADAARFASSAAATHLDRWFEGLDGYQAYIFTAFVRDLRLDDKANDSPGLYGLPDRPVMVPIDGPAGLKLYLHASKSEGLWISFDATTPAAQRDTLLKLLGDFATRFREVATEKRAPQQQSELGRALAWWRQTRAQAIEKEAAGATDLRFGVIAEETSVRRLIPMATTADERRARATEEALPADALVDFARGLMDQAVAVGRTALTEIPDDKLPAPGESAPPTIPPVVGIHADGDTYTVFCWDDDEPQAREAMETLIAEHGATGSDAVDMVGLVNDIFEHAEGTKVDALLARVQARGADKSYSFVQRYRPRRKGQTFDLTGRWTLSNRNAPMSAFNTTAASSPDDRPDTTVIEDAKAAIASMISFVTMSDPSGAQLMHHEYDALLSPRMLFETGDKPGSMIMFAMMGAVTARAAASSTTQREPGGKKAALMYDHVRFKNGQPARELRVVVHHAGTPRAFLFAQAYETPRANTPFTTIGEMRLIGPVAPIFAV